MHNTDNLRINEELANLPSHFRNNFSDDFLTLLAALRLHNFFILRADEARELIAKEDNLWTELSHPSVWMQAKLASQMVAKMRTALSGSAEHEAINNEIIRANLDEQYRLLKLLKEFYAHHKPASFYARLIIETIDQGESCLRPQGASVRLVADTKAQRLLQQESQIELLAFTRYLIEKLPS